VRWLELADYSVKSWAKKRVLERPVDKMVTFYMLGGIHFKCWLPT